MKHIIATALLLSASVARAETKTVDWFLAHPDARARVNALCRNNPGEAKHVPDCANALAATQQQNVAGMIRDIDRTQNEMDNRCADQPKLYQAAYHCGAYR